MYKDLVILSNTHQMTPQRSTQPQIVNVHHGGNHEHVQQFDEIVSTHNGNMQPHVTTYLEHVHLHQLQNLQNPQLNPNIDFIPTNSKME